MKDLQARQHMAIAKVIKQAKRRMFAEHRAGMPLERALAGFQVEVQEQAEAINETPVDKVEDEAPEPRKRIDYEAIERWAIGAVTDGEAYQQRSLLRLLHEITQNPGEAESIALMARNAAFKESESIIDEAIQFCLDAKD